MSKLRTVAACVRARAKTKLRARCMVCVALTERALGGSGVLLQASDRLVKSARLMIYQVKG